MNDKVSKKKSQNNELKDYLKSVHEIFKIKTAKKWDSLVLQEYPFDLELLTQSRLYRDSRKMYIGLGGTFSPRVCSTMRSLSALDLFKNNIEYSPLNSEIKWFSENHKEVAEPQRLLLAISSFNEISIFHEQNHRIVWKLLPPAPTEKDDLRRYLNFAESIICTLDLALGDDLGKEGSLHFEKVKSIYRSGGRDAWFGKSKEVYREYLLAILVSTYLVLELVEIDDIPFAVDYYFPGKKKMVRDAVNRALELSELFTQNTNLMWQELYWKDASHKLTALHKDSIEDALYLPEDPLDLEEEFYLAGRVLDYFDL